jgi:hypothetical protein
MRLYQNIHIFLPKMEAIVPRSLVFFVPSSMTIAIPDQLLSMKTEERVLRKILPS